MPEGLSAEDLTKALVEALNQRDIAVADMTAKQSKENLKLLDKLLDKLSDENKKHARVLADHGKDLKDGIKNTVSSLARGGSNFSSVATAADTAGQALQSLGAAATAASLILPQLRVLGPVLMLAGSLFSKLAAAVTPIVTIFEEMYTEYEKLSKVGIVTTFEDFRDIMKATNMNITDTGIVMSKFSEQLAGYGGSAIEGRKAFMKLAESTKQTNQLMQRIGYSTAEYSASQIEFMDREASAGKSRAAIEKDLAIRSQEYAIEITKLSILTGKSRESIIEEQKARLNNARYRAAIEQSPFRENTDSFLTLISAAFGKEMQDKMIPFLAEAAPTKETSALFTMFGTAGVNLMDLGRQVNKEGMAATKAVQIMTNALPQIREKFGELVARGPENIPGIADYATVLRGEKLAGVNLADEESKAILQIQEVLKGEGKRNEKNADLATARRNLGIGQVNLQLVATDFDRVAAALRLFSDAMVDATDVIRRFVSSGPTITSATPASSANRDATADSIRKAKSISKTQYYKDYSDLMERYRKGESSHEELNIEALQRMDRKRMADAVAQAAGTSTGMPMKPGGITSKTLTDDKKLKLRDQHAVHTDGEVLSPKLIELAQKIQDGIPGFKHITGLNDRGIRRFPSEAHFSGRAMDFTLNKDKVSIQEGQEIVNKIMGMGYGASAIDEYNNRSAGWTAPHFHVQIPEFEYGGVVNGPTLGLLGEAGPEVVMPLKPENIPSGFMNSDKLSELSSKMDILISVMQRQTNVIGNVFNRLA